MSEEPRASFGGKLSVILVAAGSAIGLGALWRFPYIAGKHGGAAFVLVFLLSVLVVGIPAMLAEFAVGRRTNKNAVGAFRTLSKRWSWLGYSGVMGFGIAENIVSLCPSCHHRYDQTTDRNEMRKYLREYLMSKYSGWNEEKLVYKK